MRSLAQITTTQSLCLEYIVVYTSAPFSVATTVSAYVSAWDFKSLFMYSRHGFRWAKRDETKHVSHSSVLPGLVHAR